MVSLTPYEGATLIVGQKPYTSLTKVLSDLLYGQAGALW